MAPQPQKEHQWLDRFLGEWTFEGESVSGPGKTVERHMGMESVRSLGSVWVIMEGRGTGTDGGRTVTMMTLGYDPTKKRYVGTFVGSMMTDLWTYEGELDASGKRLVLDTEGPSFTGDGGRAHYRDVIEFRSADHRMMTSSYRNADDGKFSEFMTTHYRRVK